MEICVVIPALNEARTIGPIVESLKTKGLDVLVIDDGSDDGTGEIARKSGAEVIIHTEKKGKGQSLREGFAHVLQGSYQGLICMDGDGQHDVRDIDRFLSRVKTNGDVFIVGTRMDEPHGMPFIRRLTNRVMSRLISSACRQRIPDTQCGYRFIHRKVLENIQLTSGDFEIESEMLMKASKKGYTIASIPIRSIYRDEQSKIHPFHDTIRFIRYFLKEMNE